MRRFGVVVLAVAGVWVITQSLLLLAYPLSLALYGSGSRYSASLNIVLTLLPVLITLVFGIWLIARRRLLAERWFEDDAPEISLNAFALLRIGLLVVGVLLVAQSVPTLLGSLTRPLAQAVNTPMISLADGFWTALPGLVIGVAEVLVGLLLIANSRRLATRLWFGRPAAEVEARELPSCPSCGVPYDPLDYEGGLFRPRCASCGAALDLEAPNNDIQTDVASPRR